MSLLSRLAVKAAKTAERDAAETAARRAAPLAVRAPGCRRTP